MRQRQISEDQIVRNLEEFEKGKSVEYSAGSIMWLDRRSTCGEKSMAGLINR